MLYVLLCAAVVIFLALYAWITIDLELKDWKLSINMHYLWIQRSFHVDLGSSKDEKAEKATATSAESQDEQDSTQQDDCSEGWKAKLQKDVKRFRNPDTGKWDFEALKEVIEEYVEMFRQIKDIIKTFLEYTRQRIYVPVWRIRLDFGTGDPADTGMLFGAAWDFMGILYPHLARYMDITFPMMDITPDFYGKRLDLEMKSIIKTKPAHIIHAFCRSLWKPVIAYIKHNIKGSGKHGQQQTSN